MSESTFSAREGPFSQINLRPPEYLPQWVRGSISQCIGELVASTFLPIGIHELDVYPLFKPYIWKVLGTRPPNSPMGGPFKHYIPAVLEKCLWNECYDIIESICRIRLREEQGFEEKLVLFSKEINAILEREGVPWKLHQGKVVRVLAPTTAQPLGLVSTLLTDPRFKGPDEQFAKAIAHLNNRPPDEENCVKDAVGALEAVANIISSTTGKQLNRLLKEEPLKSGIDRIISEAIEKLYAYRGAAPGAAHGQVGEAAVGPEDATWVLTTSAATIIYLADKFPLT